jgi:hypothetical protein
MEFRCRDENGGAGKLWNLEFMLRLEVLGSGGV